MLRQDFFLPSEVIEDGQTTSPWAQDDQQQARVGAKALGYLHRNPGMTSASACGKSILIGEHAVVYGAHAVALPVPSMRMQIRVQDSHGRGKESRSSNSLDMRLSGQQVSQHILSVAQQALDLLGIAPGHLVIEGQSNLWIGAGLGSSASLCVGLLRCLSRHWGINLEPTALALFANQLEGRFHGKPSGLDVSVVALEQLISFRKGTSPQPLPLSKRKQGLHFAILDSQMRSSTKTMVERAAPYFTGQNGDVRVQNFDDLTLATMRGLEDGDTQVVAEALTIASKWLDEAGVVSQPNRDLQTLAIDTGALAAKITGAGGGGAVLALLDPMGEPAKQLADLKATLGEGRVLGISL